MPTASSDFTLERFEAEDPYASVDGVDYARARISKAFHGDLEAVSEVEMLSVQADGGRGYVAIETLRGTLEGRKGTFALLHAGTQADGETWATWPIVPGSGTGSLRGITGAATIVVSPDGSHRLVLDYELAGS